MPGRALRSAPGVASPRGTYSQAVRVPAGREILYVSGLTARDESGAVVAAGDAGAQFHWVVDSLERVLAAQRGTLADLVHLTLYVTRIEDRDAIEAVRRERFPDPPPASTMVEVAALADPGLVLEVQAVAAV